MDVPHFLRTLAKHLPDVRSHLDADDQDELDRLLSELQRPTGRERLNDLVISIMDVVEPWLPPGHPVRRAIPTGIRRLDRADEPVDQAGAMWGELIERYGHRLLPEMPDPSRSPAELLAAVQRRLLGAPSHLPGEVADGYGAGLVRLDTPEGTTRLPAFQFDADGRARPLVLLVNSLLNAEEDPWGVADWWLGGNAWLGAAPADLIGTERDDDLVAAAQAELERI
ncbi:hypothetical protein GCM10009850_027480 [Nonomuraea monospora]|uniref:DUF3168 domain-containing protein n=1 Tax=Nonomuraea monospora TaxID=568818 RepID=A0ABN3CDY9_9ACTN